MDFQLVDALSAPVVIENDSGIIVYANAIFLQEMRLPSIDAWHGKRVSDIYAAFASSQAPYLVLEGGRTFRIDGSDLQNSNGEKWKIFLFVDVTKEKKFEEELSLQKVATIQMAKMTAVGEMACGIAHEINNPLAIIQAKAGYLRDLALKGSLDSTKVVDLAKQIGVVVERISKIIRGLRSFARDNEGEACQEVFLGALLEDAFSFCRERFKNHGIDFRVSPFDSTLKIQCHPIQIGQVVLNLLSNAFDAAENANEKWILVEVKEEGNNLCINVEDSGGGVPLQIREKIFEPFFTTKSPDRGMGLGLSLSRGLMESNGGSLCLDTAKQHTCFKISLPKVGACIL